MVDTTASRHRAFGKAVRDLSAAQKSGAGVPAYTRYINRPLGRLAAAGAHVLGMTPNQVTLISGVFSGASIAVLTLARPTWGIGALVAAGLIVGYILDSADGQLARLRGTGSPAGEWLDHVVDAARMPAIHLAVAIALFRFAEQLDPGLLLIPLGFLLVSTVRFFALILAEQMKRAAATTTVTRGSLGRSLVALPGDFGLLCLLFFAWHALTLFLVLYTVLLLLNAVLLVLSLIRRYRELRGG